MKRIIPLIICDTKHDACYLKNAIQKLTFFGVEMARIEGKMHLFVDECNFYKAKKIVSTQLSNLPSVQVNKIVLEKEKLEIEANRPMNISNFQKVLDELSFRFDLFLEKIIHLMVSD